MDQGYPGEECFEVILSAQELTVLISQLCLYVADWRFLLILFLHSDELKTSGWLQTRRERRSWAGTSTEPFSTAFWRTSTSRTKTGGGWWRRTWTPKPSSSSSCWRTETGGGGRWPTGTRTSSSPRRSSRASSTLSTTSTCTASTGTRPWQTWTWWVESEPWPRMES